MKMQIRKEYFLLVVKENAEIFYRYAYSVLLNRQDAEDAVSETILKAFEHEELDVSDFSEQLQNNAFKKTSCIRRDRCTYRTIAKSGSIHGFTRLYLSYGTEVPRSNYFILLWRF